MIRKLIIASIMTVVSIPSLPVSNSGILAEIVVLIIVLTVYPNKYLLAAAWLLR